MICEPLLLHWAIYNILNVNLFIHWCWLWLLLLLGFPQGVELLAFGILHHSTNQCSSDK